MCILVFSVSSYLVVFKLELVWMQDNSFGKEYSKVFII